MNTLWGEAAECKGAALCGQGCGAWGACGRLKTHMDIRLIKPGLKQADLSGRAAHIICRKRAGNEMHKNAAAQR
ncbi:hypothetical protein F2P44_05675 [Massilia sp. CCM 8695]|uniref:Uncharacterized protein n=1 Tax=Massilia frigida TaxID=2609281 RepID=A0ABX0N7Q6_9BURK|nr:hypothetical protein [Massilia frigida]NHZ78769.1 hypothetical protein [Massilia frigida]